MLHKIGRYSLSSRATTGGLLALSAIALAGAGAIVHQQAEKAERVNPPKGKFIDVDGVRVHYLEQGRGRPAVFLHGNGMMIEDMLVSGLLSAMADHPFRSIAIDRPGFGYSGRTRGIAWTAAAQAKLLSQTFARLQIERPIVFGHSMGTMVALALALNHPDQISGLVLASGYYYPTARLDVALVSPPAIPILGDLLCHTVAPLLGEAMAPRFIKKMFSPRPVPPQFYEDFPVGLMLRPSQIRAATKDATHMIADANRMAHEYSSIACPMAIIAGDADGVVDQRPQAERLHAAVPGSVIDVLTATGHMTHYADPERVAKAIEHVAHLA